MNAMQKTALTIALLVAFGAVIFIFIIQPAIIDINAFNDRIQIERVALENKYASRRNIKNIIADLKYASDGIAPLEKRIIVQKGGEVAFVSELEKIAEKNNLTQKIRISPANEGSVEIKNMVIRQNISLDLSGNYIDLLKYMNDMEKSAVYVIINSVNIGSDGKEISGKALSAGNVKAHLEGYVYFSI